MGRLSWEAPNRMHLLLHHRAASVHTSARVSGCSVALREAQMNFEAAETEMP